MAEYKVVMGADVGESFGRYTVGNDETAMPYLTCANVACGFHAGDPAVMRKTVRLAKKHDTDVGAHPGFQDLRGFGRRTIEVDPEELVDDIVYQLGSLGGFLKAEGMKMWHLSPHGWLDFMVSYQEVYADAFIKAIKDYDPNLILAIEARSLLYQKAKARGIPVAAVGYPDLKYDPDLKMIGERVMGVAIPSEVAKQSVHMIKDHKVTSVDGKDHPWEAQVLMYHAERPNAVDILKTVREEFEKAGVEVVKWDRLSLV